VVSNHLHVDRASYRQDERLRQTAIFGLLAPFERQPEWQPATSRSVWWQRERQRKTLRPKWRLESRTEQGTATTTTCASRPILAATETKHKQKTAIKAKYDPSPSPRSTP